MRIVSDQTVNTIIATYRAAAGEAIEHSDHGCPLGILWAGRASALAVALVAIGVSEEEANGPELGAIIAEVTERMAADVERLVADADAPVAVTSVPVDDRPPVPEAPPVDAVDVDTFDADAFLASLGLDDDDRFGGAR